MTELDKYEVIFKYQSSELIIQKVLEEYGKGKGDNEQLCKPNMRIYGVFAPQARGVKSAFAWNLAKHFAREQSVLYMSLTAFLGRVELYGAKRELADIMYYVHNGFDNLIYLVGSAVSSVEGVDCMPPMKSLDDLVHVPGEDWVKLLQVIISQSHYQVLVLDVEECVQQFYRLLEICSQVFMPATAWQDKARWELCEQYFERVGVIDIWKKAKKITLDDRAWRSDIENIINA